VALCPSTADHSGLALSILWMAVALTVLSGLDIVLAAQRGPAPKKPVHEV
jgi:hypothetical protein